MTAIAFNTARQAEHTRQRLETAFAVLREMLDAFASYRMQKAAAEAEHARSRRHRDVHTLSTGTR